MSQPGAKTPDAASGRYKCRKVSGLPGALCSTWLFSGKDTMDVTVSSSERKLAHHVPTLGLERIFDQIMCKG
jgi:hypothetical protein